MISMALVRGTSQASTHIYLFPNEKADVSDGRCMAEMIICFCWSSLLNLYPPFIGQLGSTPNNFADIKTRRSTSFTEQSAPLKPIKQLHCPVTLLQSPDGCATVKCQDLRWCQRNRAFYVCVSLGWFNGFPALPQRLQWFLSWIWVEMDHISSPQIHIGGRVYPSICFMNPPEWLRLHHCNPQDIAAIRLLQLHETMAAGDASEILRDHGGCSRDQGGWDQHGSTLICKNSCKL